jgi:arylsulfatase A-like enzyme
VITYPRLIEPGRLDTTHMALNIDLGPSIAELAGAVPDSPVDGQSLVPLLKGEAVEGWRTDFLIEQYGGFSSTTPDIFQGIRIGSGTYAYYLNTDEEELYDLSVDPNQMESQAYNPAYDAMRLYCQSRMQELVSNDAFRLDF